MDQATVKVVLRVKPEEDKSPSDSVTVVDEGQNASVILKKRPKSQELFQFSFLRALENSTQSTVYKQCGEQIVQSAVQGFNGTILAYGQTGSGKTYTMLGPDEALDSIPNCRGIMPRAISQVFSELESRGFHAWSVKLTFVEIYNEAFRDLLMPNSKEVTIQDTNQKGTSNITLRGVTRVEVQSEDQAIACLRKGHKSRAVSAHFMNDRSSRSHTILTLWIETTNKDGGTHRSKLNLVDLAGSERLRKTGAEGSVAKEATFINKSLSALSLVVKELKKKSSHVRYRDSKLTHYLKDSLGGNCKTLMIACIWGDDHHLGESISTCRFADDMQQVEISAERNTGVETIHGNLFKLDPVMMKYIDRVTAKKVAEEKAKLMQELRNKRGGDSPENEADLSPAEYLELEALRAKVKDFELNKVMRAGSGITGLSGEHQQEMEVLRQRVVELEKERDKDMKDAELSEAETALLEEMTALRQRVGELQKAHSLSAREVEELKNLRNRVQTKERNNPIDESKVHPTLNDDGEEMERLRRRVRELEARQEATCEEPTVPSSTTNSRHEEVVKELQQMRDRLKVLHGKSVTTLTKDHIDELLLIKNRIIVLQSEEANLKAMAAHNKHVHAAEHQNLHLGNSGPPASSVSGHNRVSLNRSEEVEMLRAENERMRRVLNGTCQSPLASHNCISDGSQFSGRMSNDPVNSPAHPGCVNTYESSRGSPEPGVTSPSGMPSYASKNRLGLKALSARFSKMMGRRKGDQLEPNYVPSDEEAPNIVILNSLTHDQLMELLRAHHSTSKFDDGTDECGDDPSNIMYPLEPGSVGPEAVPSRMLSSPSRSKSVRSPSPHSKSHRRKSRSPKPRNTSDDGRGRVERPPIVPPLMLSRLP